MVLNLGSVAQDLGSLALDMLAVMATWVVGNNSGRGGRSRQFSERKRHHIIRLLQCSLRLQLEREVL